MLSQTHPVSYQAACAALWRDNSRETGENSLVLILLAHVSPDVGFACRINFGTVDAWLQPPDVLHCSTNECHDFRSFLLASRADMM
jgi:hypothetical protein